MPLATSTLMASTNNPAATSDVSDVKGRTLCLCFDGTDESYSGCNSNVVRIFSLLKKDDPRQLVYYQVTALSRFSDNCCVIAN